MAKHGKKYLEALAKVNVEQNYSPREAVTLAKETSYAKFDATIEVHIRMGLDPRQADQQVRDVVVLPHGLGKTIRVLVFAQGEGAAKAQEGGADFVADTDEMINKIAAGWTDFDVAISTPDMMAKVGKLGRVLGPRSLMPNPKAGTVCAAEDLPRVINEAKAGRVEFRLDKTANIHVPIGKASFTSDKLFENFAALLEAIKKARPSGAKGTYIRKISVAATMGPGLKVDPLQAVTISLIE
ncbi:MAG: large subunit ribosomal protein L1 [Chloroflexi bacterium]|nr:MAG: large subunit ribosomal protein L1 [Chloroflexota bacterium]MBA4376553.1 50S ribosomal protein L1 [Anaerolinea sp.]